MDARLIETGAERVSDVELVVRRVFDAPARLIFRAWSEPELLMRWWVPKSFGITFISCEADVRTGGTYRFVFGHRDFDQPMAFHGRYIDVVPPTRIVWTNEESGEAGSVSTLTLEERDGQTHLLIRDVYPSKEALDATIESGSTGGWSEQFATLETLLPELADAPAA